MGLELALWKKLDAVMSGLPEVAFGYSDLLKSDGDSQDPGKIKFL